MTCAPRKIELGSAGRKPRRRDAVTAALTPPSFLPGAFDRSTPSARKSKAGESRCLLSATRQRASYESATRERRRAQNEASHREARRNHLFEAEQQTQYWKGLGVGIFFPFTKAAVKPHEQPRRMRSSTQLHHHFCSTLRCSGFLVCYCVLARGPK